MSEHEVGRIPPTDTEVGPNESMEDRNHKTLIKRREKLLVNLIVELKKRFGPPRPTQPHLEKEGDPESNIILDLDFSGHKATLIVDIDGNILAKVGSNSILPLEQTEFCSPSVIIDARNKMENELPLEFKKKEEVDGKIVDLTESRNAKLVKIVKALRNTYGQPSSHNIRHAIPTDITSPVITLINFGGALFTVTAPLDGPITIRDEKNKTEKIFKDIYGEIAKNPG